MVSGEIFLIVLMQVCFFSLALQRNKRIISLYRPSCFLLTSLDHLDLTTSVFQFIRAFLCTITLYICKTFPFKMVFWTCLLQTYTSHPLIVGKRKQSNLSFSGSVCCRIPFSVADCRRGCNSCRERRTLTIHIFLSINYS